MGNYSERCRLLIWLEAKEEQTLPIVKKKLEWMEQHKIDHGVMLNLSQLYCNGWEEQDCFDGIRFQNDFNASIQKDYPDKFTCGFVVQPLYIDQALKEIDRCVNELGLKMLCLPTHFLNAKGEFLNGVEGEKILNIAEADTMQFAEESYEDVQIRNETHAQLRDLIAKLPKAQKDVLVMRHYLRMSFQEIADSSDVSINTALGRMRYALINLRKLMNNNNQINEQQSRTH